MPLLRPTVPDGTTSINANEFQTWCAQGWLLGRRDPLARPIGRGHRAVPTDYHRAVRLVSGLWGFVGPKYVFPPELTKRLRGDVPWRRAVLSLEDALELADTREPFDRSAIPRFVLAGFAY